MLFPSKLVENAVTEISKLPGIGKKTALRLALHLLKQNEDITLSLSKAIIDLKANTIFCSKCNNISDSTICFICSGTNRDCSIVCVVEDTRDVLAIENTSLYQGLYFVLGGVISPVNGIGPSDLRIDQFLSQFLKENVREVILALSPTIDGDTTAFYLSKKIKDRNIKITTIARGIAVGSELEYTDEITLGRSILRRINYESD